MDQHSPATTENQMMFFWNKKQILMFFGAALFWISSFCVIWYGIGKRETVIILHYNVYFGIDALGLWWQAFLIPFSGLGVWLIHLFLAWKFFQIGEYDLSRVTLFSLFFLESMVLLASIAIGLVNY